MAKINFVLIHKRTLCVLLCLLVSTWYCRVFASNIPHSLQANPSPSAQCAGCHAQEYNAWKKSHHAQAMAVANHASVLGNFNNQTVTINGQEGRFKKDQSGFYVDLRFNEKNKPHTTTSSARTESYKIAYTFGVQPLQQYLVNIGGGKFQVMPFAWDARTEKETGKEKETKKEGQQWISLYPTETITPQDRLHWQQPLQNWNGMCADCHSTHLTRNYQPATNEFATHWSEMSVGCASCHNGYEKEHSKKIHTGADFSFLSSPHVQLLDDATTKGHWQRTPNQATAHWIGEQRSTHTMDSCFACHALRVPLTDGFTADKSFLNQFSPELLSPSLYHLDGQQKEEVYTYGSFLQSKMYQKGVVCADCHEPHSAELKLPGNTLCGQCHDLSRFDKKTHHGHVDNSPGSQCANCHMPETQYMVIDGRRDHSFKIPRPELSVRYGTPNACTQCHANKTAEWALTAINRLFPARKNISAAEDEYIRAQASPDYTSAAILALAANTQLPEIKRASLLARLNTQATTPSAQNLKPFLLSNEPLVRLGAIAAASNLTPNEKQHLLSPLLQDSLKVIRVAAANQLLALSGEQYAVVLEELNTMNMQVSWRGEGKVNQAMRASKQGDHAQAIALYESAISIDPYFEASYVNLADIYRQQQREDLAYRTFENGLNAIPTSATLNYGLGLHYIRQKNTVAALGFFNTAMNLEPHNEHYAYAYFLTNIETQGPQKTNCDLKQWLANKTPGELLQSLLHNLHNNKQDAPCP